LEGLWEESVVIYFKVLHRLLTRLVHVVVTQIKETVDTEPGFVRFLRIVLSRQEMSQECTEFLIAALYT